METSPFVKIATLSGFILLLGGFVAYRAGAFAGFLGDANANTVQAELPNGADAYATQIAIDSPPPKRATIFPSSKSSLILDDRDRVTLLTDSVMVEEGPAPVEVDSSALPDLHLMPSSKQAPPFPPPVDTGKKTKRNKKKE